MATTAMSHIKDKNIATMIKSWPTCCSTLALYPQCRQHNGRRV